MKVILCEAVTHIGDAGEVKEVTNGYARNFLFPRNLALPASPSNLKRWESEKRVRQIRLTRDLEAAQNLSSQIEKVAVDIVANAGKEGHLFGSVTSQMIADALVEKGFSVDRKNIIIESPIKLIGEYQVHIRLHSQINAMLKVIVSAGNVSPDLEKSTGLQTGAALSSKHGETQVQ